LSLERAVRVACIGAVAVAAVAVAAACDAPFGIGRGCDASANAGIVVAVLDSATSRPWADSVVVVATEGGYADTARYVGPDGRAPLVYERPGTYTVTVHGRGARPWRRAGVRVRKDGCHVETAQVTAPLQRE
jgi:hypothetical protein